MRRLFSLATLFAAFAVLALPASARRVYTGEASWYGPRFYGRRTASGEIYDASRSTIASRHIPLGARVRVTCLRTGRSGVARVTDTGAFGRYGRIADCSEGLARRIGLKHAGHGRIRITVLALPKHTKHHGTAHRAQTYHRHHPRRPHRRRS